MSGFGRGYVMVAFMTVLIAAGALVTVGANQMLAGAHRANARHLQTVARQLAHSGAETGAVLLMRDANLDALDTRHRERFGSVTLSVTSSEASAVLSCATAQSRYPATLHLRWEMCVTARAGEMGPTFVEETTRWIPADE